MLKGNEALRYAKIEGWGYCFPNRQPIVSGSFNFSDQSANALLHSAGTLYVRHTIAKRSERCSKVCTPMLQPKRPSNLPTQSTRNSRAARGNTIFESRQWPPKNNRSRTIWARTVTCNSTNIDTEAVVHFQTILASFSAMLTCLLWTSDPWAAAHLTVRQEWPSP